MRKRDETIFSVRDLVVRNTKMDDKALLNDTNEYAFPALKKAAEMILRWKEESKQFYVFADYDVDGITSGESMRMLLRALGIQDHNIHVRYPRRFSEGYGMSVKAVEEFDSNNSCIITVDNGIAAFDAIKAAKDKGMEVLVTDHHLAMAVGNEKKYPDADYIVDPNAIDGQAEFKAYCGCGIVLKLAEELLKDYPPENKVLLRIKAMAAIATIADCVPLVGENRRIVKEGLQLLTRTDLMTKGILALVKLNFLKHVSENDVAFKIAPILNATGRLYDNGAERAAQLISFDADSFIADKLAQDQIAANTRRKALQATWDKKAEAALGDFSDNHIILKIDGCPEGLVGIIAGRLCEHYKVPTIILSETEKGILKGSGRSVEDVNLKLMLDKCAESLISYGGHAAAAGLRLSNLEGFRKAFRKALGDWKPAKKELLYDLEIKGMDIESISNEVEKYGPYGEGNPAPVFYIRDITLTPKGGSYSQELAGNGLKLFGSGFTATTFEECANKFLEDKPRNVELIGTIGKSYFGTTHAEVHFTELILMGKTEKKTTPLQEILNRKAMGK